MPDASGAVPHHSDGIRRATVRIVLVSHITVPHKPQKSSFLVPSLCMLHSPHEGQGGSPFSLEGIFGPFLKIFLYLSGRHHPLEGFFTLGMAISRPATYS